MATPNARCFEHPCKQDATAWKSVRITHYKLGKITVKAAVCKKHKDLEKKKNTL